MFAKFATKAKVEKCGVCGEEAGDEAHDIEVRRKGRIVTVIHCFDCYEEVMDKALFD